MNDPMVEMLPENCDHTHFYCDSKPDSHSFIDPPVQTAAEDKWETVQTQDTETSQEELTQETTSSMNEDSELSTKEETPSAQEPTLPILQKIINLSKQIQNLKNDHAVLSNQVKTVNSESFPGPEVLETLQLLSNEHGVLKKKYIDESSERKRLYNEVIELKGNIRVFCRCRPLNQVEISNGSNCVVEFESSLDNELQIISSDSSKKQFKFDHVFRPEDNQDAVFAQTKPIVTSVLDGYNVCIFAYGQTGTGKTFTMEGTPDNRGVNYRTLEELFRISQERGAVMSYEISVSMLEVYNEKIRDLLVDNSNQPPKKLEIKQAAEGTQEVPGLVEARVYGTEEVWELLKSGGKARSVGSTNANEQSSRSHCLLRITVKGVNLIDGQKTKSHLWLVDLAGSERVGKIEVEGERLKESQFINKSLSALGDVIAALASKTSHVPYRNSKLTHMLQSSLGGDCKTLMFVQISPSAADHGETLCSLNFASRVRGIENGPARKHTDLTEVFKYKQMAEKLQHEEKEAKKLQENVQSLQLRLLARDTKCKSLQEKVRELETQLAGERQTRLKQETRAFAASSSQSSLPSFKPAAEKAYIEKKPPLGPSQRRMPLRRITNFVPPPSPIRTKKQHQFRNSTAPSFQDKENNMARSTMTGRERRNLLMQPKRMSIAVRPPPITTASSSQHQLPKRRVSIATWRPESSLTTPLHTSARQQPSFVKDQRKARYSRVFTPLREFQSESETTPTAMRCSSSKFMGSPPTQAGSWKPRHPTVVALQRKSLIWSPLKLKGVKNYRKSSILPERQ
ncbi:kinesin-like protein KIN-14S [Euphorbia lathyris]|uniref:kinesin-like protein KIN-14S n=1 Tax=Euphorbia lathyris TaxID=212925 RepID=UPI003313B4DA